MIKQELKVEHSYIIQQKAKSSIQYVYKIEVFDLTNTSVLFKYEFKEDKVRMSLIEFQYAYEIIEELGILIK